MTSPVLTEANSSLPHTGYRHIPLRNENGQPLNYASLFVHIEVKDYVPHKLSALAEALANPIAYQSMIEKRSKQLEALTDDEGGKERAEIEAADVEIDADENLQIGLGNLSVVNKSIFYPLTSKADDSNKENLDKKLGDEADDTAGNVTSLTKRMKSVRNFFAGSGSAQQSSISSGLASAASTAITANTAGQTTTPIVEQQQQQQPNIASINATATTTNIAGSNLAANSTAAGGSVIASSLAAGGSSAGGVGSVQATEAQSNLLQRQDTQTNLGAAANVSNQLTSKPNDVTASNQLEISDVPSVLESAEIINQEAESLIKLREHKRVVKVQLEMDRELAALRKKHNKQLEKEMTTMNQKRDKLMACQTKQRSLLAKTHSKLSRKSVSSDK